jgi:hypothetical protein
LRHPGASTCFNPIDGFSPCRTGRSIEITVPSAAQVSPGS